VVCREATTWIVERLQAEICITAAVWLHGRKVLSGLALFTIGRVASNEAPKRYVASDRYKLKFRREVRYIEHRIPNGCASEANINYVWAEGSRPYILVHQTNAICVSSRIDTRSYGLWLTMQNLLLMSHRCPLMSPDLCCGQSGHIVLF
jgi:hypothetical protein